MTTPVSFTVRPPTRPHSPQSSAPSSRETSSAPDAARPAFRIATAPGRPSPLGPAGSGAGRSGRPSTGGRDRFGRIRLGGQEESDDDEDDQGRFSRQTSGKSRRDEEIVGLGEGGVESKIPVKPAGPLVIASLPNRDWRQASTTARRPTYVPESRGGRNGGDTTIEREGDEQVRAGLQFAQPRAVSPMVIADDACADSSINGEPQAAAVPVVPETLEQRAMRELMISAENGGEVDAEHRDMIIGLQGDTLNLRDLPVDETDAYRRDVLTRPEVSTLDDYSSVPIEAFGEAMLRGMGWRPEAPRSGPGVHVPQRRPEGLGLGATARAAPVDEKGKKAKRKEDAKTRGGRGYVPVVKKERDTPSDSRHASPATSNSVVRSRVSSRSPSPRSEDSRRRRDRDERSRRDEYDSDRRDRYDDRPRSDRRDTRDRDSSLRRTNDDRPRSDRDSEGDRKPRIGGSERDRYRDEGRDDYRRSSKRDERNDRGSDRRERDNDRDRR